MNAHAFGRKPQPGETVTILLTDLNTLIDIADKALDGNSGDAEHDALYVIREALAEYSTDPTLRAVKGE